MIVPILLSFLAVEPTPVVVPPSTKWTVNYGDTTCTAKRGFGAGTNALTLELRLVVSDFKRAAVYLRIPADAKNVSASGARLTLLPQGQSAPLILLQPNEQEPLRAFATPYDKAGDIITGLPEATTVEVRTGKQSRMLAAGNLKPVLAALAKCGENLLRSWSIDPSTSVGAEPVGNPGEWLTDNDYPAAAMARRASGRVMLVAAVTPEGKVSGCRIVVTSGDRDLDLASCAAIYRRGRFKPSTLTASRYFVMSTRWISRG